jgi:hypothetical protein
MYIHKASIARVSKPLECLINGRMCEAQNGVAVLEGVDKQTFARFCHWTYAGYYPADKYCDRPKDVVLGEQTGM